MKHLPLLGAATLVSFVTAYASEAELAKALTLHASFDKGFEADFVRDDKGDKTCYLQSGAELVPCEESDAFKRTEEAGRFGAGLWFTKKAGIRPIFLGKDILGYNPESWSASVSLWLRLDPDLDLEPGYCDPIQIVAGDTKKGFIFLEWSKDHQPRHFRYAIRPLIELWDPQGLGWENVENRPAVELKDAGFSREKWTHAVFVLDRINESGKASGSLYLDGKHWGDIKDRELVFGWEADAVRLVLGAAYVGHLDELSVFDRALTTPEVVALHGLENGVRDLYAKP